ncbi:hypothetical protein BD310DRAFT_68028 [Dichomitus squalens]|uniref:Uncharacterized protein n=1 Tax=Dichomitus squalens TaxID=114155 RepID=A0A4Q9PKF5_9APHY|nr:hypothetical protein BD310DRAFT_68028 [Dichomitus squalens]
MSSACTEQARAATNRDGAVSNNTQATLLLSPRLASLEPLTCLIFPPYSACSVERICNAKRACAETVPTAGAYPTSDEMGAGVGQHGLQLELSTSRLFHRCLPPAILHSTSYRPSGSLSRTLPRSCDSDKSRGPSGVLLSKLSVLQFSSVLGPFHSSSTPFIGAGSATYVNSLQATPQHIRFIARTGPTWQRLVSGIRQ